MHPALLPLGAVGALWLQHAAGNAAVSQLVANMPTKPPTTQVQRDGGTGTGGDAGTPPQGESSELKAKLDKIRAAYDAMIAEARAKGWAVAADNLQRFLDGTGGTKALGVSWLRGFGAVTAAEGKNKGRFEDSLNDIANTMKHGDKRDLNDHWDRMLTGSGELFYASGTSTITSTGSFSLQMIENVVTLGGTVKHHWHDPYDWNAGQAAYVPGFGSVSDDDGLLMQRHRGAKPYNMEADWTQFLTGHIEVGRIWNTRSLSWSGP